MNSKPPQSLLSKERQEVLVCHVNVAQEQATQRQRIWNADAWIAVLGLQQQVLQLEVIINTGLFCGCVLNRPWAGTDFPLPWAAPENTAGNCGTHSPIMRALRGRYTLLVCTIMHAPRGTGLQVRTSCKQLLSQSLFFLFEISWLIPFVRQAMTGAGIYCQWDRKYQLEGTDFKKGIL